MNYTEAINYMEGSETFAPQPGTHRIAGLLELLGNPQKELRFIHVAGTNGKGSASAMLASVMKAVGLRTGLYISPYVQRFNERMQINGEPIGDDELCTVTEKVKTAADKMEEKPTVFELTTAAAMVWFATEKCSIVILETGIGGTCDATNVIDCPEAAVIMNIGYDHTPILGSTLEEIAANKAGIIKKGGTVVCYDLPENIRNVIKEKCEAEGAKLHTADFSQINTEFDTIDGQVFTYKGEPYALPLLGEHQRRNAAVVLETIEALREKGWTLDQAEVEHGIYSVGWPARFEIVSDEPYFVIDGGHNPQCMQTVAANLDYYFPDMPHVILLGLLRDKDYKTMLEILAPSADAFVCAQPDSPRALTAGELAEEIRAMGMTALAAESAEDAVEKARIMADEMGGMVCAAGSLYLAGDVRSCFMIN